MGTFKFSNAGVKYGGGHICNWSPLPCNNICIIFQHNQHNQSYPHHRKHSSLSSSEESTRWSLPLIFCFLWWSCSVLSLSSSSSEELNFQLVTIAALRDWSKHLPHCYSESTSSCFCTIFALTCFAEIFCDFFVRRIARYVYVMMVLQPDFDSFCICFDMHLPLLPVWLPFFLNEIFPSE